MLMTVEVSITLEKIQIILYFSCKQVRILVTLYAHSYIKNIMWKHLLLTTFPVHLITQFHN